MALYREDLVDIELQSGSLHRSFLNHTIGTGDNMENRYGVRLYRNGEPVSINGSCIGLFITPDGQNILISGSANTGVMGNVAYVQLPQACYLSEGQFCLAIKVSDSSVTGTMRIIDGVVANTGSDSPVAPVGTVPTYQEVLALFESVQDMDDTVQGIISRQNTNNRTIYGIIRRHGNEIPADGWIYDKFRRYQDGELADAEGWAASPLFRVYPQLTYDVCYTNDCIYVFYDSNNNFISGGAILPENVPPIRQTVLRAPDNAYYMGISVYASLVDYVCVVQQRIQSQLMLKDESSNLLESANIEPDFVYWNAVNDLDRDRNGYCMAYEPFVLYPGKPYYYANLYGYYCWVQDTLAGTVKRLSNESGETSSNGVLYVENDCYFYATIYTGAPAGTAYIGHADSHMSNYLRGITGTESRLVIECGAGKNYTRLRDAIAAGMAKMNSKVIVYPGTYDLTQEFATEIAQQSGTFGRVGIRVGNGIHVLFLPGAYVTALFPVSSPWINEHFEPFGYVWATDTGFTLEGLNIKASNCRYCVHDDPYVKDGSYHNVYKDCIMEYTNDPEGSGGGGGYRLAIGGGLGRHGFIEIIGGRYTVIDVPSTTPPQTTTPISYHNCGQDYDGTTLSDAESVVVIKDTYLGNRGCFRFGNYGSTTIKSKVSVSGCSMGGNIIHENETGDAHDNFSITEWNNIVRS